MPEEGLLGHLLVFNGHYYLLNDNRGVRSIGRRIKHAELSLHPFLYACIYQVCKPGGSTSPSPSPATKAQTVALNVNRGWAHRILKTICT